SPVARRARGAPRRGQELTPVTRTRPLMGAPLWWWQHLCPRIYRYNRHPPTSTALPAAPQPLPRARSPRRMGITFAPGTSAPAPVSPAALSEEAIDLLRSLTVGQSTIL
ncbi:hypothetical protein NDU88_011219, partial [Pleurodeles waltl]